jgi:hypothetical protein
MSKKIVSKKKKKQPQPKCFHFLKYLIPYMSFLSISGIFSSVRLPYNFLESTSPLYLFMTVILVIHLVNFMYLPLLLSYETTSGCLKNKRFKEICKTAAKYYLLMYLLPTAALYIECWIGLYCNDSKPSSTYVWAIFTDFTNLIFVFALLLINGLVDKVVRLFKKN